MNEMSSNLICNCGNPTNLDVLFNDFIPKCEKNVEQNKLEQINDIRD